MNENLVKNKQTVLWWPKDLKGLTQLLELTIDTKLQIPLLPPNITSCVWLSMEINVQFPTNMKSGGGGHSQWKVLQGHFHSISFLATQILAKILRPQFQAMESVPETLILKTWAAHTYLIFIWVPVTHPTPNSRLKYTRPASINFHGPAEYTIQSSTCDTWVNRWIIIGKKRTSSSGLWH